MRTIEVGGIEYKWRVGKAFVLIESREIGYKHTPTIEQLTGNSDYRWDASPITPSIIKRYIEKTMFAFKP